VESELPVLVDRLINRVQHWTPTRWAKPLADGAGSRADAVHALVQRFADVAAVAEARPVRPVPRLDNDLALPDQVRVLADDALAASPPVPDVEIAALASDVRALARRLG
jgi:hypothetical protein